MGLFSKDGGQTFKIIDDNNSELISVAKQKGYTQYQDMSKDGGQTVKTVRADLIKPAIDKGYEFIDVINARNSNLQSVTKEAQSQGNKFESMLRGFADLATANLSDEIVGLGAAIVPGGKDYKTARDDYRAASDLAWDANPVQYGAGAIAGLAPQIVAAPVVGGVKGLTTGAGLGALGSFGGSDKQGAGLAVDTAIGGSLGGVLGGLGGKAIAQKATKAVGDTLSTPVNKLTTAAATELDDIAQKAAVREVGGEALSRQVAAARKTGLTELENQKANLLQRLDDITRPGSSIETIPSDYSNIIEQLNRIENQINLQDLGQNLVLKTNPNQFSTRLLDKNRQLTLQNIDDLKAKNFNELNPTVKQVTDRVIKTTEQSLKNNPQSIDFTEQFTNNIPALLLSRVPGRQALDKVPVVGSALNALERPNYAVAISADKLSEIVRTTPERLGKYAGVLAKILDERGPAGLRASHYVMMQNDSEYRDKFLNSEQSTE